MGGGGLLGDVEGGGGGHEEAGDRTGGVAEGVGDDDAIVAGVGGCNGVERERGGGGVGDDGAVFLPLVGGERIGGGGDGKGDVGADGCSERLGR